jgi:uncharacterized protein YcbX
MAVTLIYQSGNPVYLGYSSDTKPTDSTVAIGATFSEQDTAKVYIWTGKIWLAPAGLAIADIVTAIYATATQMQAFLAQEFLELKMSIAASQVIDSSDRQGQVTIT